MASGRTTKVRIVRCPKCMQCLQESADVPLYKCGGCGTVLQAKNHKNDVNTRASSHDRNLAQTNELEHVSEDKESSSSSQKEILASTGECFLDQNNGRDQDESRDCNGERPGGINFSNEVSSSTELTHHENEESSPVAGANTEEDKQNESGSNFRISSTNNLLATSGRSSIASAKRPMGESISSDTLVSPSIEQLEQPQKNGFDRVRSTDTMETVELVNPSSELSGTLRDMSKSPTTRSSHAYDGSVSSYDGTDDQFPDQLLRLSKRTLKVTDFVGTKERPRRDKFPVNSMMSRNPEMQYRARNPLSISSLDKKHYAMKCSKWDGDELLEPMRHGHPGRNWRRLQGDKFPSRVPFYQRESQAGYENGSLSSHGHDEFRCSSSFHSPDKSGYPEQDKMKLLRMVYELQDQLNRTHALKGKANGRVPTGFSWKEKHTPLYYNHEAPEEENFHDSNYPRYPGQCRRGKNWPQQCKFSRMPFSGEPTSSRHQVDHSCLHRCPPDWQRSVQLPPPVLCCNKGQLCMAHLGHKCYSPSSPLPYMNSEFLLWGRDTDEQRHKDHEVRKLHLREKHQPVKRHFRPIAGGAPFITCYCCLQLLQLPADFLLFKRRCHRLRCSACSGVLKFSFQSRTHVVPYTPNAIDPPPSEVDDVSDAVNRRDLASPSHANHRPHADPVSCSDDYGLSFCRSCSTEGEPVSLTPPFHVLQGNAYDRKMPSGSSFEPIEERKKLVLKQARNKYNNPVEICESSGASSNMSKSEKFSSEIEELPRSTCSPLHRLMGYSSPSEVINGSTMATSSYYPEKNMRSMG